MSRRQYLEKDAEISSDGLYRYWLLRRLAAGGRIVLFVGLNPSTADAMKDDQTIRRCVRFTTDWGFDCLYMGNLNAGRERYPSHIPKDAFKAVGTKNEEKLMSLAQRAELVIAAWGADKLNDEARTQAWGEDSCASTDARTRAQQAR